jgi:hypothetical protein
VERLSNNNKIYPSKIKKKVNITNIWYFARYRTVPYQIPVQHTVRNLKSELERTELFLVIMPAPVHDLPVDGWLVLELVLLDHVGIVLVVEIYQAT